MSESEICFRQNIESSVTELLVVHVAGHDLVVVGHALNHQVFDEVAQSKSELVERVRVPELAENLPSALAKGLQALESCFARVQSDPKARQERKQQESKVGAHADVGVPNVGHQSQCPILAHGMAI